MILFIFVYLLLTSAFKSKSRLFAISAQKLLMSSEQGKINLKLVHLSKSYFIFKNFQPFSIQIPILSSSLLKQVNTFQLKRTFRRNPTFQWNLTCWQKSTYWQKLTYWKSWLTDKSWLADKSRHADKSWLTDKST